MPPAITIRSASSYVNNKSASQFLYETRKKRQTARREKEPRRKRQRGCFKRAGRGVLCMRNFRKRVNISSVSRKIEDLKRSEIERETRGIKCV